MSLQKPFLALVTALILLQSPLLRAGPAMGPSTGGGGHLSPRSPATYYDVARAVAQAPQNLVYILQYMETLRLDKNDPRRSDRDPLMLEVTDLMFNPSSGRNALDELPKLRFELRNDESCLDPNLKISTPASYTAGTTVLCFSLPKILAEKPTQESAYEQILVLASHELSHYMGADESMALKVESVFKEMFQPGLQNHIFVAEGFFAKDLLELSSQAKSAQTMLSTGEEFPQTCRTVDKISEIGQKRQQDPFPGVRARFFRGADQELLDGLLYRIEALGIRCKKASALNGSDQEIMAAFGKKMSVTLPEYADGLRRTRLDIPKMNSPLPLQKPVYGNRSDLVRELKAIDKTSEELSNRLTASRKQPLRPSYFMPLLE